MGFSFDLTGRTAREVADQVAAFGYSADLNQDPLGDELADLLVHTLMAAGDPGPGHQYRVKAEGHSNPADRHQVRLVLEIGIEPLNAAPEGRHRLTEPVISNDSLMVVTAEFPPA